MKAMWRVEAFGWGNRGWERNRRLPAGRQRPWVAEITGLSYRYGLQRRFLEGRADWTQMSSSGNRGVYLCWTLEQGKVYETRYFVSWSKAVREFLRVTDDGDVETITREEVDQWLADRLNVSRVEL